MDRDQYKELIQQAVAQGEDVFVDFNAHAPTILRALAADIESGTKKLGQAQMRMVREHHPFVTYVVSVTDQ